MPWALAHQVIAAKKQEISERIAALSQQHSQLVEFEASLEQSQARLPAEQSLRAMRVSGQLNVEHRQLTGGRAL